MQVVSSREEFQWLFLVVAGYLLSLLPDSFLWIACLGLVLVLGVPHGALDIFLLWSESQKKISLLTYEVFKYLLIAGSSLLVWKISSDLFWFLFFFAAVFHFGSSDEHPEVLKAVSPNSWTRLVWVFSRGILLVFTPAVFHSEKIMEYLKQASSLEFAKAFIQVAPFLCAYAVLIFGITSWRFYQSASLNAFRWLGMKVFCSVGIFILLFWVADPLVSFSLYFCFYHSLNHAFRVLDRSKNHKKKWMVWSFFLTLPILPLGFWAQKQMSQSLSKESAVTACFVAIAALTFPHLVVVERLHLKLKRHFQKESEHKGPKHLPLAGTF